MIYLDLTRLLNRLGSASPTGIDRVEFEYARHFVSRKDVRVVVQIENGLRVVPAALAQSAVRHLHQRWSTGGPGLPGIAKDFSAWKSRFPNRRVMLRLFPLPFTAIGSVYINVGHAGLDKTRLMGALRRRFGLRKLVYIHDVLPNSHPHLFAEGAEAKHGRAMANVALSATHILTNSLFSKRSFEDRFGRSCSIDVIGVSDFPEGLSPPASSRHGFVAVGTLEPRKNYLWLARTWLKFRAAHAGAVGKEKLTIIGKMGWLSPEDRAELEQLVSSSPYLELRIGAPDDEVIERIRNARALLSAAVVEGWGMPLAESMALGTPIIVTDVAAHQEVSQGLASFYKVNDPAGFERCLLSCYSQPEYDRMLEDTSRFKPWRWSQHFERLESLLFRRQPLEAKLG